MARLQLLYVSVSLVTNIISAVEPPCRKSPEMDSLLGGTELVVYGGKGYRLSAAGLMLGDTWKIDLGETNQWQELLVQSPAARWKTSATPASNGKAWILFGGCIGKYASGVQNDLWVFSATTNAWRQVFTKNVPPPRRGHVTSTNSTHLIIFGGKSWHASEKRYGTATVLKDVWALPLSALDEGAPVGSWTQGSSLPAAARWGATGTVLNGKDGRELLVLYGGRVKVGKKYVYFETLHVYDFFRDSWTEIEPDGLTPGRRDHHAATSLGGDLWVFGGRIEPTRKFKADVADLWSYSIVENRWTRQEWKGKGPSRRFMPSITGLQYKGRAAIAMFGGEHFAKHRKRTLWKKKWELYNDLWIFDTSENRWHEISPSSCPGIPEGAELLEDRDEDDFDDEMDEDFVEEGFSPVEAPLSFACVGAMLSSAVFFIFRRMRLCSTSIEDCHARDYQHMPTS